MGLLPLLEGLPGTEECQGYRYLDSRRSPGAARKGPVETPKTVLLRHLTGVQTKMRALDKVASRFATERVTALLSIKKAQKRVAVEVTKAQKAQEKLRRAEKSQQMVGDHLTPCTVFCPASVLTVFCTLLCRWSVAIVPESWKRRHA